MKNMTLFTLITILLATPVFAGNGNIKSYKKFHKTHYSGKHGNVSYDYAKVIKAEPIYETVSRTIPHQQCWHETVRYQEGHSNSPTGAILGGLIGAAIGNEVGHRKRNKQVGAVAGALLGASVGHDLGRREGHSRYGTEQRCETIHDTVYEQQLTGYQVTYKYKGKRYSLWTDRHPGDRIKVETTVRPIF